MLYDLMILFFEDWIFTHLAALQHLITCSFSQFCGLFFNFDHHYISMIIINITHHHNFMQAISACYLGVV
jgi:hypothetical protein